MDRIVTSVIFGVFDSTADQAKSLELQQESPNDSRKICCAPGCGKRIDFGVTSRDHPIVGFHFCYEHADFLKTDSIFHIYVDTRYWGFRLILLDKPIYCLKCQEQIETETVCFAIESHENNSFESYYHPNHTPHDTDFKLYGMPRCIVLQKNVKTQYEKLKESVLNYTSGTFSSEKRK